ncbi:GldM family protein [Thermoflexibacter ruber]|nr:GldM family protein [Thermoflexibacter ruber]
MKNLIIIFIFKTILFTCSVLHAQSMLVLPYKEKPMPLYLNYENEVVFNIENRSSLDNLRFEAEGGEIYKGAKAGVFIIIPKDKEVVIRAYEGEKLIAESKHEVRTLPMPEFKLFLDDFEYNPKQTFLKEHLDTVQVKAEVALEIQEYFSKKLEFQVSEIEVFLLRNNHTIKEETFKGAVADLTEFLTPASSGDLLIIEVKTFTRINSK